MFILTSNVSVAENWMLVWVKIQGSTRQGHFKPSEKTAHFISQLLIC